MFLHKSVRACKVKEGWGGGLGKLPNGGERALDEEHWEKIASCLNATRGTVYISLAASDPAVLEWILGRVESGGGLGREPPPHCPSRPPSFLLL